MYSFTQNPQKENPIFDWNLQKTAQGRKPVRQAEGLAAHCNAIGSLCLYIQICNLHRCYSDILDYESGA